MNNNIKNNKTIVLTGGGTAGHIMPNLALIPYLNKHFDKIYYIGTNAMEKEIVKKHNIEFFEIKATKFIRKITFKNLLIPFKLLKSICDCKKILKKLKPNIIFAKGGYVSLPVAIAGKQLNIPVVCHESDYSVGLSNKIITKYSKVLCTSFMDTAKKIKKAIYTGAPIRQEIFTGNKQNIKNISYNNKPTLLFLGGSLGSKAINEFVYNNIDNLLTNYNVMHIAGKNLKRITKPNYLQMEFCSNIEDYFSFADIVICRSGANTIFELLCLNKLMLLIPLPKDQSRGDQIENAEFFKNNFFAEVLEQNNLSLSNLNKSINSLFANKDKIIQAQKKCPNNRANENILNVLIKFSNQ